VRIYGVSPNSVSVTARAQTNGSSRLLGLRGLPSDFALLLAYLILSRSFIGDEARLGIKIGPIPIFVTDATLVALIAISIRKHAGRLLNWTFSGGGAGAIGRAVWLLFLIALVYFALAFHQYRLLAMRDLAIFGYSLFFPLTYFALTRRVLAAKLVRYFIYAVCVGAALFNFQLFSGVKLFELVQASKALPGHQEVRHLGAGNLASLGCALSGLLAYVAVQRERRGLHACAMLLCAVALALSLDRSSVIGFFLAAGLMFVLGVGRSRVYLTVLAFGLFALVSLSGLVQLPLPGGETLNGVWQALSSGANFQTDPDAQFRLQRWQSAAQAWMTSPVFGVGFGAPIVIADTYSETTYAAQRSNMGSFNEGMPHNTFLMVLARIGPLGLGLISFAWIAAIVRILKVLKRRATDPDQLAILAVLIAMVPDAALNLFFERPLLCAPFWIMLAASYRLSETALPQTANPLKMTARHRVMTLSRQPSLYPHPGMRQDHEEGGWQARWR
jgi:O-antigen ligase